jgi:hypothetical protein
MVAGSESKSDDRCQRSDVGGPLTKLRGQKRPPLDAIILALSFKI